MATREVFEPDIGKIILQKRRGSRSLRLTIAANNSIRVTQPHWLPFTKGYEYALSQKQWILDRLSRTQPIIIGHGDHVGKAHRVEFAPSDRVTKPSARLLDSIIRVNHPSALPFDHELTQAAAARAATKALRHEATQLLPQRLTQLARQHNFSFRSVKVKQLTGRWGSCSTQKDITLSLYLMQLPWNLIDYVLLHELTHTKIMQHGPKFWRAMEELTPGTSALRKALKKHKPILQPQSITSMA